MENHQERTPSVLSDENDETSAEEYENYKNKSRKEYEELLAESEFRSHRGAIMNYNIAAAYDKKVYYMEFVAAFIGAVSLTSIGAGVLHLLTDSSLSYIRNLGVAGLVGLVVAFIIEVVGKGSQKIFPSLSRRASNHVDAAAGWQTLEKKARSYRIQINDPMLDVSTYAEWHLDVIKEKEKLSSMVCIPEHIYRKFNNADLLLKSLINRRELFLRFRDFENN